MAGPTTTAMSTRMVGTVFDTATTALATLNLTDAQNEINKRLAGKYDFSASPFNTTTAYPPIYVTLIEQLAVGYTYRDMARGSKEGYARAKMYIDGVMDNIDEIVNGDAQIVDSTGAVVDEIDGDWAVQVTTAYPNTFNEDDPENWEVSTTKLDDIGSERDDD